MKEQFHGFILLAHFLMLFSGANSQSALSIEQIMTGERFTGYSPERINWSPSANKIYFDWNPDMDTISSLYSAGTVSPVPVKVSTGERKAMPGFNGEFNKDRTKWVYAKDGDIFILQVVSGNVTQVTNTTDFESNPVFSQAEDYILFNKGMNLFSWELISGALRQLTDFRPGKEKPEDKPYDNENDKWLNEDQLKLFKVLQERKQERDISEKEEETLKPERPKTIYTGTDQIRNARLSPDGNFITWIAATASETQRTLIPEFVTESGYTEEEKSRSKVGAPNVTSSIINIYDIKRDTVYKVIIDDIPGIDDQIKYAFRQPSKDPRKPEKRGVIIYGPEWSDDGRNAMVDIFSADNKDRWIMLLEVTTGHLKLIDRQHDEAWIGGPGIRYGGTPSWLPDNRRIWFQSEASGYSHIYTADVFTGQKKAVTSGDFEIYNPLLSRDRKYWYCLSNESDPGIRELYRISVSDGSKVKLTNLGGGVEAELSPDEKYFALRVSYATKPWELYLLQNKEKAVPLKITESVTSDFRSYSWRQPEFIRFKASDGVMVPARLYKPSENVKNGAAVVFVHGAGYLQNVHKWWSSYFREYMFHNFLVDNGYTVLDIDYRGSSGYGREWRTAIYRHMGGRDLDDHIDGAGYLVKEQNIDPGKIGIYGGSYGGFITLMALFTKPGTFRAGAALRPVTDWAHYNHGYNEPNR